MKVKMLLPLSSLVLVACAPPGQKAQPCYKEIHIITCLPPKLPKPKFEKVQPGDDSVTRLEKLYRNYVTCRKYLELYEKAFQVCDNNATNEEKRNSR
jgi:hypothetical protein